MSISLPTHTGQICRLRPLKESDKKQSIHWRNKPEIREMVMGYRYPVTEAMESRWYADALAGHRKDAVFFAIETLENNQFVGIIQLNRIDWVARTAFLGIMIGETSAQSKGMGSEAMKLLLQHAFELLNLRKICIEVAAFNQGALRFYEQFRFEEEGCWRQQVFLGNAYHDLYLLALYKKRYLQTPTFVPSLD